MDATLPARRLGAAMTDLRNLELYEDKQGGIFLSRARPAHSTPVPAVVGITVAGFDVTRDELDALDRAEERDRYREALERITARYVGGASAGELADIAFEALRGESE